MLGLPPPMLYSFGPWINYLTVHFVLTALFSFFPSVRSDSLLIILITHTHKETMNDLQFLHLSTLDTVFFPLDALVRTTAIIGSVSLLSPSSASAKQISPLYVNSPLTHMIIGALASAGGGLSAGTLGTWTNQWNFSTPPVLRAGVGLWGSLDVWGGSLVGMIYLLAPPCFCLSICLSSYCVWCSNKPPSIPELHPYAPQNSYLISDDPTRILFLRSQR